MLIVLDLIGIALLATPVILTVNWLRNCRDDETATGEDGGPLYR